MVKYRLNLFVQNWVSHEKMAVSKVVWPLPYKNPLILGKFSVWYFSRENIIIVSFHVKHYRAIWLSSQSSTVIWYLCISFSEVISKTGFIRLNTRFIRTVTTNNNRSTSYSGWIFEKSYRLDEIQFEHLLN